MRLRRPIQTRFRYGFPTRVNLATYRNSQAHSSKGTRSLHVGLERPTRSHGLYAHGFRYYFTTPHRGTFHLSLTVLVRYRSPGSIQAYQVVLADSHEISRAPCYSGN